MYSLIFSTIFLSITIYAIIKNHDRDTGPDFFRNRTPFKMRILLFILLISSFILITKNITILFELNWHYSILISFITFIINTFFGRIYIGLFGIKSKLKFGDTTYNYTKENNYVLDSIITFIIGLLLIFYHNQSI